MLTTATSRLAQQIDALLPQTQCTKCGYEGCMPYAEAIAAGAAQINRCPPGGDVGIAAMAALLSREPLPLDPDCGTHVSHRVAIIDEEACIGCAKCLPPCPTDAIVGASKFMHTVVAALCTGCELCIAPCPVDCISMIEDTNHSAMMPAAEARSRFDFHQERLVKDQSDRSAALAERERLALERERSR